MPPQMTSEHLVDAVDALWTPSCPIVDGDAIRAHAVGRFDHGGTQARWGRFFELSDHGEAATRARLAKFKRGNYQSAPVGWCRVENAAAATAWGTKQARPWRRLRFDARRGRWIW